MDHASFVNAVKDAALLRGTFTLRSGRTSSYYLDKYLFETQPEILDAIGDQFAAAIAQIEQAGTPIARVAGAELGGIPLVTVTSLKTGKPSILVRNQKKDYGTAKQMEGKLQPGDNIIIVEDIVTTGGQTLEAAKVLKEAGANVVRILVVIDRQEGARENIEGAGFAMDSLLTKVDLGIDD
jgi:orotate phosphoribosyltransferase